MLHLVAAAALAAPTVNPWTARTLRWGELSLATDGLGIGVAPQVQASTSLLLDVLGLPNGGIRVAAVETRPVALSLQGSWTTSDLPDLGATVLRGGPALSLHGGPLDLHGSADYLVLDARGEVRWQSRALPVTTHAERLVVHGGLELAVGRRDRVVATGGVVPWGRASGADVAFAPLDVATAGSLGTWGAEDTWWGTLGWQHTTGALTVRAALGASAQPWVWLRDALSVQVRFGPGAARPSEDPEATADAEEASEEPA